MNWVFVAALIVIAVALWGFLGGRKTTIVYEPNVALLYRDGRFVRELGAGRHIWYDWQNRSRIVPVTRTETSVSMAEMTVMSRDQFSFRIGLSPVMAIEDPRRYQESLGTDEARLGFLGMHTFHPTLHAAVAAAAVDVVGRFAIADVVSAPAMIGAAVKEQLADAVPGAVVAKLFVTSINLPPETRKMFTDVERAKMEGLAAVERARGEHAALRVLANAARLSKDNPELANLRLLQTIESSKASTTIILGNTQGLPPTPAKV